MFIIPRLPKTQEEEYKVYPWASSLCFSAHKRANAQDFTQYLAGTKQRVHHRCPPAGIQVSAEQIRLLAHHHVTDQPFSIHVVVYRHLGGRQVMGQLIIVAKQVIQRPED